MSFELELTSIAHGGLAVGRHEGRVIFVPFGVPGERIRARILQDKGRYAFAEVLEVLTASPARVVPRCKHLGVCGGCHWQHVDYQAQLEWKRQVVVEQMTRIGGFKTLTVYPTRPSPTPWAYRTHVTFHITHDGQLGFVALDDKTVIPIHECHIIRPPLVEMFAELAARRWQPMDRIRLQVGSESDERIMAHIQPQDIRQREPMQQSELGEPESVNSGEKVYYTIKGRTFQVTAGGFFQVNLAQAEVLVDLALERLELTGSERALDLYSGVGLFTAFLAERAARVTSIELYTPAIEDARRNLTAFENVDILEGAIEHVLPRLKGKYDVALIDPPRAGMKPAALDALAKRQPRKIVYVSCEPSTLARDARRLVDQGYRLLDIQPVDMFPQTYHVESVASFTH